MLVCGWMSVFLCGLGVLSGVSCLVRWLFVFPRDLLWKVEGIFRCLLVVLRDFNMATDISYKILILKQLIL